MESPKTTPETKFLQLENQILKQRIAQMISDIDDLANMPDATKDIRLAAKLIIISNDMEPFSLN
jgi:hypothetical protein